MLIVGVDLKLRVRSFITKGSFGYLSCLCFSNYVSGVVNGSRA